MLAALYAHLAKPNSVGKSDPFQTNHAAERIQSRAALQTKGDHLRQTTKYYASNPTTSEVTSNLLIHHGMQHMQ